MLEMIDLQYYTLVDCQSQLREKYMAECAVVVAADPFCGYDLVGMCLIDFIFSIFCSYATKTTLVMQYNNSKIEYFTSNETGSNFVYSRAHLRNRQLSLMMLLLYNETNR